jgi:hypothetical protein
MGKKAHPAVLHEVVCPTKNEMTTWQGKQHLHDNTATDYDQHK